MSVSRVLFSFKGRLGRKLYWPSLLGILIVSGFLGVILATMNPGDTTSRSAILLIVMLYVFVFWSSLALSIKRLHDCDYSGWFVLISCIPIAGWLWFLVISLMRGTVGENRFGLDPVIIPDPTSSSPRSNPQTVAISVALGGVGMFVVLFAIGLWRDHDRELQNATADEQAPAFESGTSAALAGAPSPNGNVAPTPGQATEVQLDAAVKAGNSPEQTRLSPKKYLVWDTFYQAVPSDPSGNTQIPAARAEHRIVQGGSISVSAACTAGPIVALAFTLLGPNGDEAAFNYFDDPKPILKIAYRIDSGQRFLAISPLEEKVGPSTAAVPFARTSPNFKPVTVEQDLMLNAKAAQGDMSAFQTLIYEYTPQDIATFLAAQSVEFQLALKSGMPELVEINPQEKTFQAFLAACKSHLWQKP